MTAARNLSETTTLKIDATTITIGTLPNRVMLAITEMGQADQTEILVRFGVVGWKGFETKDGESVPCERKQAHIAGQTSTAITMDSFDAIPVRWMPKISGAVFEFNSLTDDDVGNSSAPLQ